MRRQRLSITDYESHQDTKHECSVCADWSTFQGRIRQDGPGRIAMLHARRAPTWFVAKTLIARMIDVDPSCLEPFPRRMMGAS